MNKDKFLKELEKKLHILADSEKDDIISEYRSTIEEKVAHGQTEAAAVQDFGSIEELSKEILSAYKIKPDFNEKKISGAGDKTKEIVDTCEEAIKKGAKKMAEITDNIAQSFKDSNTEFTLESIFEIVIKVMIILLVLAILRIPFAIIGSIGSSIFSKTFGPFREINHFGWELMSWVLYTITCILIIVLILKKYVTDKNSCHISENNTDRKKTKNIEKIKDETLEVRTDQRIKKNDGVTNLIILILKVFVVVCFMFPLALIVVTLFSLSVPLFIYAIKGLPIWGAAVLILGIAWGFGFLLDLIHAIIFNQKKPWLTNLLISSILVITGAILTAQTAFEFDYYNKIPKNNLKLVSEHYTELLYNNLIIENEGDTEIVIDDNVDPNECIVQLSYYSEIVDIDYLKEGNTIRFKPLKVNKPHKILKKTYKIVLDNIKDKEFYNYVKLANPIVAIRVNSQTANKIIIKK